ncbi:hypothetical protein [Vibrio sp. WXL210]|uniref:hypothetical protein n=1 Tax=Vibrio sp. WXL210 TaxID=3450709 RepID=UPI003EC81B35
MKNNLLVMALGLTLAGCGGSSGDDNGDGGSGGGTITDEQVIKVVESVMENLTTNYFVDVDNSNEYPVNDWNGIARNDSYRCRDYGPNRALCEENPNESIFGNGLTMRYNPTPDKPIQVFMYTEDETLSGEDAVLPSYVSEGMALIQEVVGYGFNIFSTVKYLYVEDAMSINFSDFSATDVTGGIIVADGYMGSWTPGGLCGAWGAVRSSSAGGQHLVDAQNHFSVDKGWSWVTVAGETCGANAELVAHEFMHAFGFKDHFDGFGNNGMFDVRAKSALRTLYKNDAGLPADQLQIHIHR